MSPVSSESVPINLELKYNCTVILALTSSAGELSLKLLGDGLS